MKYKLNNHHLILAAFLSLSQGLWAQQVTISNNLLYDATLTPNLRVGVRLAPQWSMGLTAGYRPWPTSDEATRKYRHLLVSPSLRYWTDSVNVHHFFGVNLIYSHYNVGGITFPFGMYKSVRDERREGDLGALGVFYGYSWPLGRYWNIEALIGAAVGYTKYNQYACGHCGRKIGNSKKLFVMPQAALNIVYNIPGRPRRVVADEPVLLPAMEQPLPTAAVVVQKFQPAMSPALRLSGPVEKIQKDNPMITHVSQYKPYDRTNVLRKDKKSLFVHYPFGRSVLRRDFRDNAATFDRIIDVTRQVMADSTTRVKTIQIVGLSSIEGPVAINERLSEQRALALQKYVQEQLHVPDSVFETLGGGEAWPDFRDQLEERVERAADSQKTSEDHREELRQALNIIDSESKAKACLRKLRQLNGGRTWSYMKQQGLLGDQRNAGYVHIYYDYAPDPNADIINKATNLLRSDCGDCHRQALEQLLKIRDDERAQNPLGVALYLCGRQSEALSCFRRAAAAGNQDAVNNLKQLEKQNIK